MTNEELILMKLEKIESQLEPAIKFGESIRELKDDLIPLQNIGYQVLVDELEQVQAGFNLDDLLDLIRQMMRNTNDFVFALKAMANIIEFANDIEPLLKLAVPQAISALDKMEQKGVFRMIKAMMDIRAKVASAYDADDIDQIGDVMVRLLGLTKKLSDPATMELLEKFAELPSKIDLEKTKKVGPFKLASAGFNSEVKEGLGVMIELTKAMGKLKNGNGDMGKLKDSNDDMENLTQGNGDDETPNEGNGDNAPK